jgi:hypothetical protein
MNHRTHTARHLANLLEDVALLIREGETIETISTETIRWFTDQDQPVPTDAAATLAAICGHVATPQP